MKMRKFAVVAALLTVATGITAGGVNAAAAETPVNFTAQEVDGTSVITTDAGSLVAEEGAFRVKAPNGTTIAATPLTFRLDDFELPIAARRGFRVPSLRCQGIALTCDDGVPRGMIRRFVLDGSGFGVNLIVMSGNYLTAKRVTYVTAALGLRLPLTRELCRSCHCG